MIRAWLFAASLMLAPVLLTAAGKETCGSCHEQPKKIVGSVHADLGCTTCHTDHETYPHKKVAKPKCADCHEDIVEQHALSVHGQELKKGNAAAPECTTCHGDVHEIKSTRSAEFHQGVPETCGMCHSEIAAQYKASVHGQALAKGIPEAPICNDCHGEHNIQRIRSPQSPANKANIRETCGSCHADVRLSRKFNLPADRIKTFEESYHGLAAKAGSQTAANCASCHGIHNILPSSDPKSTINPKNLAKTCGACHPGTSGRYAIGPVHIVEGRTEPKPVQMIRELYLLLIPLTIGLMMIHNIGDWVRKVYRLRVRREALTAHHGSAQIRMFPFERLQHVLLLLSFSTLVWTGFALKYPDAWWALPLTHWERTWPVRGTVHRIAGAIMLGVAGAHLISLLANRKLRDHWKQLIPRYTDLPQAVHSFAYNVGLTRKAPKLPAYNFIEKAEYWAVVWGAIIMGATGILLWANTFVLSLLPKVVMDVATTVHLYEAILAALAILVWHLYFVIVDPEVYPVDTTWITGKSVRPHHDEKVPSGRAAADAGGSGEPKA
jgi:cytochrome b subunit of formate dehydrogenase